MITKTITFEDFNGKTLTEEFCFHLSEDKVIEMELSKKGGLTEYIKRIVAEEDGEKLVAIFKDLLTKTVGKKSPDGRKFIQNQEITDDFVQTPAYSKLFVELSTDAGQAAAFINGVVPASMQAEIKKKQQAVTDLPSVEGAVALAQDAQASTPLSQQDEFEEKMKDPDWVPTQKDLQNMSPAQIAAAFQRKQAQTERAQSTP